MSARTASLALLLAFLIAIVALASPSAAQTPVPPPPVPSAEATPDALAVPEERRTPRAALRTFLEAFYVQDGDAPDLAAAAAVLDLSAVPRALRSRRGQELATQLKAVLDRVERIEIELVSDQETAEPWRLEVGDWGEVVLAPDGNGDWRFTAATLAAVPELYRATRDLQTVEGVREGPQTVGMWIRGHVPDRLEKKTFILETWQWLGLLVLAILGVLVERLVAAIMHRSVVRRLARRFQAIDTDVLATTLRPVGLLAAGLFWWSAIFWLDLPASALGVLLIAVRFAVVVAVVWVAYRLSDLFAEVLQARATDTESKFDDLLAPLVRKSLKIFVAAFGLVFIADNLDVDISSLLAGLGIGGIAVALAAQDIVKNLFGSLMVILDRPFAVGDSVTIGDITGTVTEVGFRSTRIRTGYNSLITMPNARLISSSVDNMGARQYRRWRTTLGVTYDTPPAKLESFCEGVRELIRRHPGTRKDAFEVHVNVFSESSIDILLYTFFETDSWSVELAARHRLALDILRLAERLGVSFAYPTQTIHMGGNENGEGSGGDRPSAFDREAALAAGRQEAAGLVGAGAVLPLSGAPTSDA